MKNVTKILTAAVLCAALFASTQRTDALGGNAAFWPGDEANITAFPAQMNNHAYVQLDGVGSTASTAANANVLFNHNGTSWSFGLTKGDDAWFNLGWGKNGMAVRVAFTSETDAKSNNTDTAQPTNDGMVLSYGNTFDWGELGVMYMSGSTNTGVAGAVDKDWDDNGITVNFRRGCDFWIFDSMVAKLWLPDNDDKAATSGGQSTVNDANNIEGMSLEADWFTHWNAGAADVLFAMGFKHQDSHGDTAAGAVNDPTNDGGALTHDITVGIEANMTDWATFRASSSWTYQLSGDDDMTGPKSHTSAYGLGFNWGDFTADFTASDDGLFGDPLGNMIGYNNNAGAARWNDVTKGVTLTYTF